MSNSSLADAYGNMEKALRNIEKAAPILEETIKSIEIIINVLPEIDAAEMRKRLQDLIKATKYIKRAEENCSEGLYGP